MIKHPSFKLLLTGAALICLSGQALADPPSRIGRLSYIDGTVSARHQDSDQWEYAIINEPVTTGDAFWTEPDAHGEIQAGATAIRLDNQTELDVVRLDDTGTELNVPQGTVNLFVHRLSGDALVVDTPQGSVKITASGQYRIEAGSPDDDDAPDSPDSVDNQEGQQGSVTVFHGHAIVDNGGMHAELGTGQAASLSPTPPFFNMGAASASPFDAWVNSREQAERPATTLRYVSPEVTGYQDLDAYGQWAQAPQYGTIWYPNDVQAGWAPYHEGHWDYVRPWGWTWVDDRPWGFAPFHYGRWVQVNNRWGWWPGEQNVHPVYAPALVAFIGGSGSSFFVSGNQPSIGWVPLGPHEVYRPWYNNNQNYWRRINRPAVGEAGVTSIMVTARTGNASNGSGFNYINRGAASALPAQSFGHDMSIHNAPRHVSPQDLAHASAGPASSSAPPAPTTQQIHGEGRNGELSSDASAPHPPRGGAHGPDTRGPDTRHPTPQPRQEMPPVTATNPAAANAPGSGTAPEPRGHGYTSPSWHRGDGSVIMAPAPAAASAPQTVPQPDVTRPVIVEPQTEAPPQAINPAPATAPGPHHRSDAGYPHTQPGFTTDRPDGSSRHEMTGTTTLTHKIPQPQVAPVTSVPVTPAIAPVAATVPATATAPASRETIKSETLRVETPKAETMPPVPHADRHTGHGIRGSVQPDHAPAATRPAVDAAPASPQAPVPAPEPGRHDRDH